MNNPILFLGFATTPFELVAFLLAVATVVLTIRQIHWAWLFAILSASGYVVVFSGARLYGDMGLQFVFIAVSGWGWLQWVRGGHNHDVLEVSALSSRDRLLALLGWLAGFGLISLFLKNFTDTDVPFADGFLTAGSLVGQLLLSRKKIENWHVWILVDLLYVGLYIYKNLMLTAILYAMFVVLALMGLRSWNRSMRPVDAQDTVMSAS